ncbi:MAG: DUF3576 domain-containing protein [Rickettsiaceae bacterium]|nr:DUF3576 domain-containing protein [Rickettsiaceae bacterium]
MKYIFIAIIMILPCISFAEDDGYPKSREDRKADEMGSVIGGEGVVFRPGTIRNESTKTPDSKVNKFLWQASKEILESVSPLATIDSKKGVLSTDWYSDRANPNRTMKLTVNIRGNVISPEAVDVTVQQRTFKNGRWLEGDFERSVKLDVETKILRRAKELYINSSR